MPPYDFPNNLSNLHITIIFKLKLKKKDLFLSPASFSFFILSFLFLIFLEGGIIYSKLKFLKTFYPQHKMEK